MVYEFAKYPDETLVVFSDIRKKSGEEYLIFSFERPTDDGFDTVVFELPSYKIIEKDGNYTKEEIKEFKENAQRATHLFFKYVREGWLNNNPKSKKKSKR
ncbi:MAG: hypothetical protein IJ809_07020 [Clostridia bacterium]|nr:hypothetical protein [Clostridia bacterium]